MNVIQAQGMRLAVVVRRDEWQKGLHFYSDDADAIQVGIWGYDSGKVLATHAHNIVPREILRTQEVVYVVSGAMRAEIYSEDGTFVQEVELRAGDIFIALVGGHGYEILEDDTYILEAKSGPFVGAERDKRVIGSTR